MQVYIVERGQYSAREIVRVFGTESAARDYCERVNSLAEWARDRSWCTAYDVDSAFDPDSLLWDVFLDAHGVLHVTLNRSEENAEQPMELFCMSDAMQGYIRAPDAETARKIAGDQIAMQRAQWAKAT